MPTYRPSRFVDIARRRTGGQGLRPGGGGATLPWRTLDVRGGTLSRRCASLTLDNLDDLPRRAGVACSGSSTRCAREAAEEAGDVGLEKEAWLSATLLEWGSCGKIVYVDTLPAGYVTYAPPVHVPRSLAFPTSPVSGDAVLLMTARLLPEFTGGGLGRMLVQTAAKDLSRRGVRAIEAFGRMTRDGQDGRALVAACCPPTSCSRWASRRCGRTTASRGCGWTCAARCPGGRTSRWRWSGCSAR